MEDERVDPADVEATGIFLRLVAGNAPEEVVRLLLSAPLDWLAEALAEMRAREYDRGYRQCRTDQQNWFHDTTINIPDGPSRDELAEIRGEEPDPDRPGKYRPKAREGDYPGGRWPGKAQPEKRRDGEQL